MSPKKVKAPGGTGALETANRATALPTMLPQAGSPVNTSLQYKALSPVQDYEGGISWLSLYPPVTGDLGTVAQAPPEAAKAPWLVNGSISARKQQKHPALVHPEERTAWAVITVSPAGLGVKKQDKVTVSRPGGGDRGEVVGLSDKSRRRLMQYLMRIDVRSIAAQQKNPLKARAFFVTLTYPREYPEAWERCKAHLRAFRSRLERAFPLVWAVWVQEFQKRGAAHYHVVIVLDDTVNVGGFRSWLSRSWYEVVGSGDEKHLRAGTSAVAVYVEPDGVGNLMGYLAGYLGGHGKREQGEAPVGANGKALSTGRMWGFWRKENIDFLDLAVVVVETLEAWEEFKRRVAKHYQKSPYLSKVDQYIAWGGGLLFGDGLELMTELLEGIEGISLRRLAA